MKNFIITLVLLTPLLLHTGEDNHVYEVYGKKRSVINKQEFSGEVYETKDNKIYGYVQKDRSNGLERKRKVEGSWTGMGRMRLHDDHGNVYDMNVEE